jgi:8-oxo-dGTP pyrophosphatase MutT (NUDIX family)
MKKSTFEIIPLSIIVDGLLDRLRKNQSQVSILVLNQDKKWILGKKPNFYPQGVVRMLGGGVDKGEDFLTAAQREFSEETGILVEKDQFIPLVQINVTAKTNSGEDGEASFPVYLLKYDSVLKANDDVKGFAFLDDEELRQLITKFKELPNTLIPGETKATWFDYGKIWSVIHEAAFNSAQKILLQK